MVLKEKEYKGLNWIFLVLDKGQMLVLVKTVVKYRVPWVVEKLLNRISNINILGEILRYRENKLLKQLD